MGPEEPQPRLAAVRPDTHRDQRSRRRAATFRAHLDRRVLDDAYRYATLVLGNGHEAEDAVHDAALSAWVHWQDLRDPDRFPAWFGRILVNACRDRLRARRRAASRSVGTAATPEQLDGTTTAQARSVGDPGEELARRDLLARALDELPSDLREVIVLRYWADLTVEEIARRTTTHQGTVKSRLHRAMAAIRSQIEAAEASIPESHRPRTAVGSNPPGDLLPHRKDQNP